MAKSTNITNLTKSRNPHEALRRFFRMEHRKEIARRRARAAIQEIT